MQANMDYRALKGPFLAGRTAAVPFTGVLAKAIAGQLAELGATVLCPEAGEDAAALVKRARDKAGGLDILVNCPDLSPGREFLQSGEADWRDVIDAALLPALAAARAAIPFMLEKGYGRVVNVSSIAGKMGLEPYGAHVAAAAAALHGLTKALAREFAARGVAANSVYAGITPADLERAPGLARYADWTPQAGLSRPEEVAKAVAFFCSEQAGFFTGCCLDVNGGLYMD